MTPRENITELVLKLRALGSGTTSQSEAFAAMAKAERLMASYQISEAELLMAETAGDPVVIETVDRILNHSVTNGRNRSKTQMILYNLGRWTEVKVVMTSRTGVDRIHAIGARADVELFDWLFGYLSSTMTRSYDLWARRQVLLGRGAKVSFETAFAMAVSDRLGAMATARDKDRRDTVAEAMRLLPGAARDAMQAAMAAGRYSELTSTALVVVSAAQAKLEAVEGAYNDIYGKAKLGKASAFRVSSKNGTAFSAGKSAGKSVGLGRPIGGASGTARIGA